MKNNQKINTITNLIVYLLGYTLVLILVSLLFKKTIYIDSNLFGFWAFLAAVIIFILNKTIRPILIWLTLPITALTLGLFYPFVNVFILKITDWLLGSHLSIHGIVMPFIVAILISFMNIIMEEMVIKPIIRKD